MADTTDAEPDTQRIPDPIPPSDPGSRRSRRSMGLMLLVGLLIVLRLTAIGVLLDSGVEDAGSILGGDARRYEQIDSTPGTPYRDFDAEYPPVILGFTKLIHAPTPLGTITRLAISQLALELATAALLAWGWSKRVGIVYLLLGTPMCLFPFPWVRTDLVPVFLVVAAMVALRRNQQVLSGVLVGVAVFAKLWPLAMAPLFLVGRQVRAFAAWTLTLAVGLALWVLWAGPSGIDQVFTFRGAKGWQIESLPGIVIHMVDPASTHLEQGAWRTAVEVPSLVRLGLTAVSGLTVVLAWWWANRHRDVAQARPFDSASRRAADLSLYGLAPLAAITALLVFSSIISPQYILWLIPFAAIVTSEAVGRWIGPAVGGLTLGLCALTTLGFATIHAQVNGLPYATIPVLVRDLGLVALLVIALVALAPRPTPVTATTAA